MRADGADGAAGRFSVGGVPGRAGAARRLVRMRCSAAALDPPPAVDCLCRCVKISAVLSVSVMAARGPACPCLLCFPTRRCLLPPAACRWAQYKLPGNCDGNATWQSGNATLYVDARTLGECRGGQCWRMGSIDRHALQQGGQAWRVDGSALAAVSGQAADAMLAAPRLHPCSPTSALQRTLAQLAANGTGVAMYSDQPPYYKSNFTTYLPWAHAKGLLHFERSKGIWLRHSLPDYPNTTTSEDWMYAPIGQTCNGQYLLCLSLSAATLDGPVAALLSQFKPYFYQARSACQCVDNSCASYRLGGGPSGGNG